LELKKSLYQQSKTSLVDAQPTLKQGYKQQVAMRRNAYERYGHLGKM